MTAARTTIAISRQRGSGGAYVGRLVADHLGLRYIDRELLRHAAEYLCTHRQEEPKAAHTTSWWERLGQTMGLGAADVGYTPPSAEVAYEGELFDIERRLMVEIAADQDSVIVGRGAAQTLKGQKGMLSVFLFAPDSWRAVRVRKIYESPDARTAERMIRDSDRDRGRFIHALCGNDWTDMRGYDLAIDISAIGLETAADLIVRAASR
jgi:cytidylate kinase